MEEQYGQTHTILFGPLSSIIDRTADALKCLLFESILNRPAKGHVRLADTYLFKAENSKIMDRLKKCVALPIVALAVLSQVAGCASVESRLSMEPFVIDESPPEGSPSRLNLLALSTEGSAFDSSELLESSISPAQRTYGESWIPRFWTLVSVNPEYLKTGLFKYEDHIVADAVVNNGGELVYNVWDPVYHDGGYFIESDLLGEVGRRIYTSSHRALGVTLDDTEGFYFDVYGIGDLRARWRTLEEVPVTPESGVAFKYKVDQSGNVQMQGVHADTDEKAAAYQHLIDQLKLRYIGGSAPSDQRFDTVHSGKLYIEQLLGDGAVDGTHYRFKEYKADMLGHEKSISRLDYKASQYDAQRTRQAEALAAEKRRNEAARVAKIEREKLAAKRQIEREKLAAKRQKAERERQAYLATPEGRAETAARLDKEKEQARLYRVARATERAKWPSGAVGKLSRGALVCTSVKGAAVASAYGRSYKDCDSVSGDRFISSMYDSGHGRNIKSVSIIGGGQWYVNGSDIEQ